MSAGEREHELIERCLRREVTAWQQFIDQFLPLFYHVVQHTAAQLSMPLSPEDLEDTVAEVLACIVDNNFQVLRQFEGRSKLGTYLVVVARRMTLRALRKRLNEPSSQPLPDGQVLPDTRQDWPRHARRPELIEEIHEVLRRLPHRLRQIIRMYYLEGRSYEEISTALNIPINSIGPALSRARRFLLERLREREEPAASPPPAAQAHPTPETSADAEPGSARQPISDQASSPESGPPAK